MLRLRVTTNQLLVQLNRHNLGLNRRLDEYERERDEALQWGEAYFESPLNQYLLSKRLTFDWERTVNLMAAATGESGCQIHLC